MRGDVATSGFRRARGEIPPRHSPQHQCEYAYGRGTCDSIRHQHSGRQSETARKPREKRGCVRGRAKVSRFSSSSRVGGWALRQKVSNRQKDRIREITPTQ